MVKKYYCDYCDRLFPYSVDALKRHTSGHLHISAKKRYYNKFKTATERLNEELQKKPCKMFHSGLKCAFGEDCFHSHFTDSDIDQLKFECLLEQKSLENSRNEHSDEEIFKFIQETMTKGKTTSESFVEKLFEEYNKPNKYLKDIPNLPPSLKPFTVNDLLDCQFAEWG